MRTLERKIEDLKNGGVMVIGFVGENQHTRVVLDAGIVYGEYPHASVALTVGMDGIEPYPAVVTRDGDTVVWDVLDSSLTREGYGEIQLTFTDGTVVVRTYIGQIRVLRSIVPTGEIPEPLDDFLAAAGEALTAIPETIDAALEAAKESGEFDGFSPTVTIEEITGGHRITVTDAEGPHSVDVMNGGKGDTGNGIAGAVLNNDYTLTLTWTNGSSYTTPSIRGAQGNTGVGIASITKTGTSGLVDTYTILYTNGQSTTFTVTNGADADPSTLIDDNAGTGDTGKAWSANKLVSELAVKAGEPTGTKSAGKVYSLQTVNNQVVPVWADPAQGYVVPTFYIRTETCDISWSTLFESCENKQCFACKWYDNNGVGIAEGSLPLTDYDSEMGFIRFESITLLHDYVFRHTKIEYYSDGTFDQTYNDFDAGDILGAEEYENLIFPIAAGTHCIHDGRLYKSNCDIDDYEGWDQFHWDLAPVLDELSTLKQAINQKQTAPASGAAAGKVLGLALVDGQLVPVWDGFPVSDVQVNGVSVLNQGVANVPVADANSLGVLRVGSGLSVVNQAIYIAKATDDQVKAGAAEYRPIVPSNQHKSAFYALAKAAGADMKDVSGATVGVYPKAQKKAIRKMLGIPNQEWELIADVTLDADSTEFEVRTDSNGQAFKLSKMIVIFVGGASTTGNRDSFYTQVLIRSITGTDASVSFPSWQYPSAAATTMMSRGEAEAHGDGAPISYKSMVGASEGNSSTLYAMAKNTTFAEYIRGFRVYQTASDKTLVPSGSNMKIYGIRIDE